MKYLGIDLGTNCGWAVLDGEDYVASGTWDLSERTDDGGGWRYFLFCRYLENVVADHAPDAVAYELVRRHGKGNNTKAAQVWGAYRGHLQSTLDPQGIPYYGVEVGTVKKKLTGKGNASKELMCQAANTKWGLDLKVHKNLKKTDDNEADALAIALALKMHVDTLT